MQCFTCKYLLQKLSLFAFASANFSIITSQLIIKMSPTASLKKWMPQATPYFASPNI